MLYVPSHMKPYRWRVCCFTLNQKLSRAVGSLRSWRYCVGYSLYTVYKVYVGIHRYTGYTVYTWVYRVYRVYREINHLLLLHEGYIYLA